MTKLFLWYDNVTPSAYTEALNEQPEYVISMLKNDLHACKKRIDELEEGKESVKESKYPYVGVNSLYGAYAIFHSKDEGILLSSGSSWVKEGSSVLEKGFTFKQKFAISDYPTLEYRELLFLQLVGFDTKHGFWNEDLAPYKRDHKFMYEYLINYKGK